MGSDLDETRAELERVCHAAAGADLAGAPFYVVMESDLPVPVRGVGGCTSTHADALVQKYTPDRWRGRGRAILVCDKTIVGIADEVFGVVRGALTADEARTAPESFTRQYIRRYLARQLFATAVHEVAHVVDREGHTYLSAPLPRSAVAALSTFLASDAPAPTGTPPFQDHEFSFVRLAMHAAHRAKTGGIDLDYQRVVNHGFYGLSSAEEYAEAIGDERDRLAHLSLAEIRATQPPDTFRRLWTADFVRWCESELTRRNEQQPQPAAVAAEEIAA
jgi:hypothetical protein